MGYTPTAIPDSAPPALKTWLRQQLSRIASNLQNPQPITLTLDSLASEPGRPANGMIVYADGSNWNPGSGAGFYGREAGAWVKL